MSGGGFVVVSTARMATRPPGNGHPGGHSSTAAGVLEAACLDCGEAFARMGAVLLGANPCACGRSWPVWEELMAVRQAQAPEPTRHKCLGPECQVIVDRPGGYCSPACAALDVAGAA